MYKYYPIFVLMTLVGSLGGFFFKKASSNMNGVLSLAKNKDFYIGGAFYGTAALVNVWVLQFMPISVVLPLTSFTYIWTMFIARWKLGEPFTKKKVIGLILIVLGAICLGL